MQIQKVKLETTEQRREGPHHQESTKESGKLPLLYGSDELDWKRKRTRKGGRTYGERLKKKQERRERE